QTLVALQRKTLASGGDECLKQTDRTVDRDRFILAAQHGRRGRPWKTLLQRSSKLIALAGIDRAEQSLIEDRAFIVTADPSRKMQTDLMDPALSSAFVLLLQLN